MELMLFLRAHRARHAFVRPVFTTAEEIVHPKRVRVSLACMEDSTVLITLYVVLDVRPTQVVRARMLGRAVRIDHDVLVLVADDVRLLPEPVG